MREKEVNNRINSHSLLLEERRKAIITGVLDVDSFDENTILLITEMGGMSISGSNLHISKLNLDDAQLIVEGEISNVSYVDAQEAKQGFVSRLFR